MYARIAASREICGPIETYLPTREWVPVRAADAKVLADYALCPDPSQLAIRLDNCSVEAVRVRTYYGVSADHRRRSEVGGRVDARPLALVLNQHESSIRLVHMAQMA